jgi:hypothetical protein
VRLLVPEVILLLKFHDVVLVTLSELFHFPGQRIIRFPKTCIIRLQHKIVIFSHVPIMFALFQKHERVLVIATMHLVFEHLIEVFICVLVLEWRPCLLVALISLLPLFPLYDLRNLTPPEILISMMGIVLLLDTRSVSHGHSLHHILHHIHHQVELVIQGLRCRWLCISLGSLIASVESMFDLPRRHHIYLDFDCISHHHI